jgi:hypothetical protein
LNEISKYFCGASISDMSGKEGSKPAKEFPPVAPEAIVKPQDERPIKLSIKPEEVEEKEANSEFVDPEYVDMDSDGNLDWDPAV